SGGGGRRVFPERDPFERPQRIAGAQGPPRRGDRGVHVSRNPVALVTPPAPGLPLFQAGSATTEQGVADEARSIEGRMAGGAQAAPRQGEGVHPEAYTRGAAR